MTRLEVENAITRQRLLEAAGQEFAERGFRSATVRDICQRAGANVAAVNYHFGDKETLYAEAVRYAHMCATRHPDAISVPAAAKKLEPKEKLRLFVRGFFMGILDEGKPAWHAKLMAREMAEPTAVLNEIAQTAVKPRVAAISAIIREVLGPGVSQRQVYRCARSIVGQILFYHFARPMLERVFPDEPLDASRIDELTDHVTEFSYAALLGMKNKRRASAGGRR